MRLSPSRPRTGADQVARTTLPGSEPAAGAARRFLRAALADWAPPGPPEPGCLSRADLVEDGTLLVSELVTNAVIHAGTTVDLLCRLDTTETPAALVIEVSDLHPARFLRGADRPPADSRESGRGLQLVAALSDAWGISYRRERKTVWCRLDLEPEMAPGPEATPGEGPGRRPAGAASVAVPGGPVTGQPRAVSDEEAPGGAPAAVPAVIAGGWHAGAVGVTVPEVPAAGQPGAVSDEEAPGGAPAGTPAVIASGWHAAAPGAVGVSEASAAGQSRAVSDVAVPGARHGGVAGEPAVARAHPQPEAGHPRPDVGWEHPQPEAGWERPEPEAGWEHSRSEVGGGSWWGLPVADLLAPLPVAAERRADAEWIHRGSLSFLAEASDLLAGQLDEDTVASLAAQLLVPRFADWCAVWLYPHGAPPRLAHVWHVSEQQLDVLRGALEQFPPPPDTLPPGSHPWTGPLDPGPNGHRCGTLAVPLVTGGRCLGTLLLGRNGLLGLPAEVSGLMEDFARRVALAVGAARQYARQAMISSVLQRGLLPPAAGRIPGVEHAVVYEPMDGDWVGGDFYDLFPAGDGRWCFALGDACGNGPEAASLTGIARPVLRLLAREGCRVADVLNRLNKALADEAATAVIGETATWEGGQSRFLSLLYGEIVPYDGRGGARCTLASAGHPLPLHLGSDGEVLAAARPQMLLGISESARYVSETFDLYPGETLLCVTDGVTERRRGDRQLDDDNGLTRALSACRGLSAAGIAERIRREVHAFAESPPSDDLAILVLQSR
ncbi:SpoIIE family protein phosphatase [Streptomyces sp. CA-111067]|uniref:SpoIIE family protein phosphatase n=1 Tax=Streptomyces sp. CA-111067 TaxID=3240046 RepID=UPI003D98FF0F